MKPRIHDFTDPESGKTLASFPQLHAEEFCGSGAGIENGDYLYVRGYQELAKELEVYRFYRVSKIKYQQPEYITTHREGAVHVDSRCYWTCRAKPVLPYHVFKAYHPWRPRLGLPFNALRALVLLVLPQLYLRLVEPVRLPMVPPLAARRYMAVQVLNGLMLTDSVPHCNCDFCQTEA